MKRTYKYMAICLAAVLLMCSLTGCGQKKVTAYQAYVQNILDVNYKGIYDAYIESGGSETDAISMHRDCIANLTSQLISHYNLSSNLTVELNETYTELAETIYSNCYYKVSEAYKEDGTYYVDVTVWPLDTLNQSYNDIIAYIDQFNIDVDAGLYDDWTKDNYNYKFALGITNILKENAAAPEYQDGVIIKVPISDDGSYYSISTESLAEIDAVIIATEDEERAALYTDEEPTAGKLITED